MTSGERMIWAAEFVRAMTGCRPDSGPHLIAAIARASALVDELHALDRADLSDGQRAKLDDMQGVHR